jgi:glycosyltransferase involved in cell wall biosynthesis
VLDRIRQWDHDNSARVDRFVAISKHVRQRIQTFYGRDADVVYPPVNTERCTPNSGGHDRFDLIVSALVPYKRIDIAIEAYNKLKYPLIIVGTGTEYERLRALAGPHISFKGWASDESILDWYRRCRMLIFPGEEDFGIVPVEAQACGKPVVAFGKGGATESIVDGETGIFFHEQNAEHLAAAISSCGARDWDATHIRKNAERFSEQNFIDGLAKSIHACMTEHSGNTHA